MSLNEVVFYGHNTLKGLKKQRIYNPVVYKRTEGIFLIKGVDVTGEIELDLIVGDSRAERAIKVGSAKQGWR